MYIYEGEVIKLNTKDFNKWVQLYKNLNLVDELEQIDMELNHRKESGENVKKWFVEVMKRLYVRNKHQEGKPRGDQRKTRDIPLHEELTDRSWADEPLFNNNRLN